MSQSYRMCLQQLQQHHDVGIRPRFISAHFLTQNYYLNAKNPKNLERQNLGFPLGGNTIGTMSFEEEKLEEDRRKNIRDFHFQIYLFFFSLCFSFF